MYMYMYVYISCTGPTLHCSEVLAGVCTFVRDPHSRSRVEHLVHSIACTALNMASNMEATSLFVLIVVARMLRRKRQRACRARRQSLLEAARKYADFRATHSTSDRPVR